MSVLKKQCAREPFHCKRVASKMRNTGRVWKIVIPFYDNGFYLNMDTLAESGFVTEHERVAEYDIQDGLLGGAGMYYLTCKWTNYGQFIFDQRVYTGGRELYNGSDGAGGYLSSSHWPDWLSAIAPSSYEIRSAECTYRLDIDYYSEHETEHARNPSHPLPEIIEGDSAHFNIVLGHNLFYSFSTLDEPGERSNNIFIDYPRQTYRCYDVDDFPLSNNQVKRFHRILPTEPISPGATLAEREAALPFYGFPPYVDAYHVDLLRYSDYPNFSGVAPS